MRCHSGARSIEIGCCRFRPPLMLKSGRPDFRREPGIRTPRLVVMDSGLATKRWRPGMTEPGQWTAPREPRSLGRTDSHGRYRAKSSNRHLRWIERRDNVPFPLSSRDSTRRNTTADRDSLGRVTSTCAAGFPPARHRIRDKGRRNPPLIHNTA